jgi:hypothetical protein
MSDKPDIILSGRESRYGGTRSLYIYEFKVDDEDIIFSYRFSDWNDCTENAFYILKNNTVYFNRDEPIISKDTVKNYYRPHAWSNDEIRSAIEDHLVSKIILGTYA